jgi:hypothetical protein
MRFSEAKLKTALLVALSERSAHDKSMELEAVAKFLLVYRKLRSLRFEDNWPAGKLIVQLVEWGDALSYDNVRGFIDSFENDCHCRKEASRLAEEDEGAASINHLDNEELGPTG